MLTLHNSIFSARKVFNDFTRTNYDIFVGAIFFSIFSILDKLHSDIMIDFASILKFMVLSIFAVASNSV